MSSFINGLRSFWVVLSIVFIVGEFKPQLAMASEQCENNGVVFGFSTVFKPRLYRRTVRVENWRKFIPPPPNGEPITYDLFYNDTEGFSDFVETFDQRLQEQNGLLAGRFELILFFRAQAEAVI